MVSLEKDPKEHLWHSCVQTFFILFPHMNAACKFILCREGEAGRLGQLMIFRFFRNLAETTSEFLAGFNIFCEYYTLIACFVTLRYEADFIEIRQVGF